MATPHGPRPISNQGQVSLPREVLAAIGLVPGKSAVFVVENNDPPRTILLIPEPIAAEWFKQGLASSRKRGQR